jgi:hypothetical protein
VRRLALAGFALPALVVSCGWPGSNSVAAAVRCLARQQAPPTAAHLPAVWRTHSMPAVGYSIALPDNWDGLALGTSNQEARLVAAGERSPALDNELRDRARGGSLITSGPAAYLAISTEGERLDVGLTDGARVAINCAGAVLVDALSSTADPGQIRRARFPAGDVAVLTYQDHSVIDDGVSAMFTNWLFVLGTRRGVDLLLLFSAHRESAQQAWPVVWAAMESLRTAPAATAADGLDPQPACLFPDLAAQAVRGAPRGSCALPVGRRLAEANCGPRLANPGQALAATIVPRSGGRGTPTDGRRPGSSDCLFYVPEDGAVFLGAGPFGSDLVAYVDLRFPPTGKPIVSIDVRQHGSQAVSATTTPAGLFVTEYGVGGVPATSLSGATVTPASGVHRLVVSAAGPTLRVWLDGVETVAPVQTHVVQPGTAGIHLATEDGASNEFTIVRGAVYTTG